MFIQEDPAKYEFTLRRVQVTHRFDGTAFVRSQLDAKEQQLTPDEERLKLRPRRPLKVGDLYLTSGILELRAALEDRLSTAKLRPANAEKTSVAGVGK
jgi:cobalt-zinc-cadmium efflux system membrane fusion protein